MTHTATPWFASNDGGIWRRDPKDLYENGGGVAGDKPIAVVNRGWYGENEEGFPVEANAAFIVRACNAYDELVKTLEEAELEASLMPANDFPRGTLNRMRSVLEKCKP